MGLIPGLAMDLTTFDEHGNPWDFNNKVMLTKAKELVKTEGGVTSCC